MITNKNIVITGGSSGIGKAILEILAKGEGNRILAACRSAAKITGFGENVIPFSCDLSTREGVDALFLAIDETFDKADILISNAGAPYYEVYDYVNWDRVENIYNLNVLTPVYTYTKYLEHLKGRPGHLAYTISAMGELALPGYALYSSTKFAMKGFQQAIRLEMPDNLTLTCIYPVSTDTNFFNVGGNGIEVERPFPVQSAEAVAKASVKAIEKGKKQVYPCHIYRPSKALMTILPPVRSIYWNIEKGRLRRFLARKAQAAAANMESTK
ncbi:MAG: SDR family NAD(P)-dependent oxidoreductase [Lachnospiraceae bacterium]|nr:SDR family NAD(P)-dependent oxidoreductase [Lachnospiraceae bacterium]